MSEISQDALVALSKWIDAANAHRDPEAVTWGRIGKIAEENGEVILAFIGATGQNPRKGKTHSLDDVCAELLDVAVTALGAYEHVVGHTGGSLRALDRHIIGVASRAGVLESHDSGTPDRTNGSRQEVPDTEFAKPAGSV